MRRGRGSGRADAATTSVREHHRHAGLLQHRAGGASQDLLAPARVAVAAHHHQVGALLGGVVDDRRARAASFVLFSEANHVARQGHQP